MEEELEDKPLEQTRQGYRGAKRKASEGGEEWRRGRGTSLQYQALLAGRLLVFHDPI